jgi:hypothetical protein
MNDAHQYPEHGHKPRKPFSATKEAWGIGRFSDDMKVRVQESNARFRQNHPRIAALYFDIVDFVAQIGSDNVRAGSTELTTETN